MSKTQKEILTIDISDHQAVVAERYKKWTFNTLKACGLSDEEIALGFSDYLGKWQEAAASAGIDVVLLADGSTEITFGREKPIVFLWSPPQVVRLNVPAAGKRTLLFSWTEPE
jgi:hypothetical protein